MDILLCISLLSLASAFPNNDRHLKFQQPQYSDSLVPSSIASLKCPVHQHWSSCKSHCGKNCNNYQKNITCLPVCIPGCVCDEGYVLGPDEECILMSQCEISKVVQSSPETDDFCPPKEKFSRCLAHCQRNCSNWSDLSLSCQKVCVPGCICINGMVRGPHGDCIRPRKCPPREFSTEIDGEIECPLDEHLEQCTAHCQRNCSNWTKEVPCQNICIKGCVCDRGYVRDSTGRCVLAEKCPSLQESPRDRERKAEVVCPKNEQKSKYRALPYSKNLCIFDETKISVCPLNYLNGCVCNQGLFRDSSNKCVELRKLPRVNEIDFMHADDLDYEDYDYEEENCHHGNDDKHLLERFSSIESTESIDHSSLDSENANSDPQDLLKNLLNIHLSNSKDNSDLDVLNNTGSSDTQVVF